MREAHQSARRRAQDDVVDVWGWVVTATGALLVDLDIPFRRLAKGGCEVAGSHEGIGVDQGAATGHRVAQRLGVVADEQQRAAKSDGVEEVVHAAVVG